MLEGEWGDLDPYLETTVALPPGGDNTAAWHYGIPKIRKYSRYSQSGGLNGECG